MVVSYTLIGLRTVHSLCCFYMAAVIMALQVILCVWYTPTIENVY